MTASTCGCCELPATTPLEATNRPGLSAIVFRTGTYATFRLSMLQRIARAGALSALRTRRDDDYAITLFDMWATVADVLTFYQERIANEGFLRTARLRDSILRMARLLDYQLRPGVAATTLLAFSLDKGASLQIPVGLRVQSVPGEDEKPQTYETLESSLADARLNRMRILPAPEGFNPLAKGNTSAILAPGPAGLAGAAALSPGDRLLLFEPTTGHLEELAVRDLRVDEDHFILTWSGPIQASNWDVTARAYAVNRTFRLFGYNTPQQYMEATETPPPPSGHFVWTLRTFAPADYATPFGNVLELDSKYEGIAAGSRLLVAQPGSITLVTVTTVGQGQATFIAPGASTSPFQDTVTRLTLDSALAITDRRATLLYEVKSPRIRFWGYRYPDAMGGATVNIPARRLDTQTAEIGRAIQNNAYTRGAELPVTTIDAGRKVVLLDSAQSPSAAIITAVAVIGLDVTVTTTPDDLTTALELLLDPESAQQVIGLQSAALPASFSLTSTAPELSVTIGSLPPRIITLGAAPITIAAAASALQAALAASLPTVPEFTESRVLSVDDRLLVLPGVPGVQLSVAPTPGDQTTAAELGLAGPDAFRVDGLFSGDLSTFPAVSSALCKLSVTLGPIGPHAVSLASAPATLAVARTLLEQAIRAADPAPAFRQARVLVEGSRLLVLPGTAGSPIQEYVAVTLRPESPFQLEAASAALLGNVALASHGEKVSDEVLGDGDASAAFQDFELQKKPLTYTPSAGPGGVDSTLKVLVSDVLWSEVPTLFGQGPTAEVYTTRLADDGTVSVRFGDGRTGARLPSGRGNVAANYRHGSGLPGRVAAGSLRSPLDMPVGLKSITNPAAATGGADPESIEQARQNAPTTVRTFGRAVSLRDFEDLVRSSGEVAKALATWVWNGEARAVHLTIAAQRGQLFTDSDLARIHASLNAGRDPNHVLFVANFVRVPVVIAATVRVEPDRVGKRVGAAARAALLDALAFDTLSFGQPLALSEIYRILQQVPGVESVDIDLFQFKDRTPAFLISRGATADPLQRSLRVFAARPNPRPRPPAVLPAELAVIETAADDVQITPSGGLPG
ncbi:MAG: putative baseplate assembly protein [Gemmatimonadales bacterium]